METIKFRAWLKDQKRMIEVGSIINLKDEKGIRIWPYGENPKLNWLQYDKCEIMQYIGRKDLKDKGIYEGDICLAYQNLWKNPSPLTIKIIYNNKFARFEPVQFWGNTKEWKSLSDGFKCDYKFEIIGNIYENPELLNK